MFTKRSVASVVILTLVTCGIYGLYWVYTTMKELESQGHQGGESSPTIILLLCIFTGTIGYLIFGLSADSNLNSIRRSMGMPETDTIVLYLLLGFFIPIVLIAVIQYEMNKFGDMKMPIM